MQLALIKAFTNCSPSCCSLVHIKKIKKIKKLKKKQENLTSKKKLKKGL